MSHHPAPNSTTLPADERTTLGRGAAPVVVAGIAVGVAALGATWWQAEAQGGTERWLHAYLSNFAFFLSLSLGGIFFVLITHVARTGATVVSRRIGEIVAANCLTLAVLVLPILWQTTTLYHRWAAGDPQDSLVVGKAGYLNVPAFMARWALYFAVWIGISGFYLRLSRRQDATGDPRLTLAMQRFSPVALLLFAVTTTLASLDLLMSLDPHWYSTIFGVYYFSGAVVGFYATQTLLAVLLRSAGVLRRTINREHYHDMGKMLFAFVVFWAYIAYSQYMLYWYGNLPAETEWFIHRGASTAAGRLGPWSWVLLALMLGHFVLPLLGLISRSVKRRPALLGAWAVWLLGMHWLDLCWVVMPDYAGDRLSLGVPELGCLLGLGGVYVAGLAALAGRRSLVAVGDPRLPESLAFENV